MPKKPDRFERAYKIACELKGLDTSQMAVRVLHELSSVEREVWLKAEAEAREMQKIIERAFIRPMDQVIQQDALLDFADWCKQQAEVSDDK